MLIVVILLAAATAWFCVTYVAWREQKQMAFIQGAVAGFAACMLLGSMKHEVGRPGHFADVFGAFMDNMPGVRKVSRTHSPSSQ